MKIRSKAYYKGLALALVFLLFMPILTACGTATQAQDKGSGSSEGGYLEPDRNESFVPPADGNQKPGDLISDRKLTRTVDLRMETQNFVDLTAKIESEVIMTGGYIQTSAISGEDKGSSGRLATYVLRIPAAKLDDFLAKIKTDGNVLSQSNKIDDITLQYSDTETRLASLRIEQETLMGLLERAETIEDIITIQDRLTNIRWQVESYEAQKRLMDNQVEYSVLNISLAEVKDLTPVEAENYLTEAARRFNQAWKDFVKGIRTFSLDLISAAPMLILLLVLAIIAWILIARSRSRYRARQQEQRLRQAQQFSNQGMPPMEGNKESRRRWEEENRQRNAHTSAPPQTLVSTQEQGPTDNPTK